VDEFAASILVQQALKGVVGAVQPINNGLESAKLKLANAKEDHLRVINKVSISRIVYLAYAYKIMYPR